MKITIVTGAFFPVPTLMGGAVEKVWFALGQEFARQGHEVVHISRAHPQLPASETIENVRHLRVSGFAQPRSGLWLKLLDLLYSIRVRLLLPPADILVTNTFWLPILSRNRRHGLLYIHVQRGPKGQMRFYAHAARLLAVSGAIADAIVAEVPPLKNKVRVIPNALPFKIVEGRGAARERVILFVGRVHPEKGLELLVRAFAQVPSAVRTGWRLRIVGPSAVEHGGGGPTFLAQLQQIAAETSADVEWIGPVFDNAELAHHYDRAPIFVYPSVAETGEALPVAPMEAMGHGCVPVVSHLSCFDDYIENGANGFRFDHRASDPTAQLTAQLSNLLQQPAEQLRDVGNAAQSKAAEFGFEPVAKQYLADFETLLAASAT